MELIDFNFYKNVSNFLKYTLETLEVTEETFNNEFKPVFKSYQSIVSHFQNEKYNNLIKPKFQEKVDKNLELWTNQLNSLIYIDKNSGNSGEFTKGNFVKFLYKEIFGTLENPKYFIWHPVISKILNDQKLDFKYEINPDGSEFLDLYTFFLTNM